MKDKDLPDHKLIQLIRQSPQKGLQIAIEQYGGLVKTICKNILSDEAYEDVEEAFNDSFVKLWSAINNKVVITVSIKSYLAGISRHCALDKLNQQSRNDSMVLSDEYDLEVELDMSSEVIRKINTEILRDVLKKIRRNRISEQRKYYIHQPLSNTTVTLVPLPSALSKVISAL